MENVLLPHLDNRKTYSHARFSLIAFSYRHRIPPQGRVQSELSSYDNIIVRTVKGQTTTHVLFYVASAERTHRWLQHCFRANTLQSASGKGINASEDPRPSFHPSPLTPACMGSCLILLTLGYVLLSCSCPEMCAAAESTLYMLPSSSKGHIRVIR